MAKKVETFSPLLDSGIDQKVFVVPRRLVPFSVSYGRDRTPVDDPTSTHGSNELGDYVYRDGFEVTEDIPEHLRALTQLVRDHNLLQANIVPVERGNRSKTHVILSSPPGGLDSPELHDSILEILEES